MLYLHIRTQDPKCYQNKAIVIIRLHPSPLSRPICHIACAHKFSEYYLRLAGILNLSLLLRNVIGD